MATKMADRIASMEQQLKALKERNRDAETKRKHEEAHKAKKDDARRKVLAGTLLLALVERGEITQAQLREWLDSELTKEADRALFDL